MKKFLTALLCVISLTMALFAFTACSNKQTYNCVGYDFTADDGEEMDMLNMLNSLTLVLNNDKTCTIQIVTPGENMSYNGTWEEKDGYITTDINSDWSMHLKKEGGKLIHTARETINGKQGTSVVTFEKA